MPLTFRPRAAVPLAVAAAALVAAPAALADPAPSTPQLVSQSTWTAAQPLIGSSIFTPPVVEGGWSAFAPIDDNDYWTISDRGPNGQPTVNGVTTRTFLSPAFTPTIYKVHVGDDGSLQVQARIPLHLRAGATDPARAWMGAHSDPALGIVEGPPNQITGLSEIVTNSQGAASGLPTDSGSFRQTRAQDEDPFAADGVTELPSDPYGLDTEGIAVDPRDGSFWLGDEYRPSLVHVAADGTILSRIVPQGVSVAADSSDPSKFAAEDPSVVTTQDLLPRAFAFRRQNRGMEGATLTKDGKTLFGMLQSSIEPPAGHGDQRTLRLVRFDVSDPAHPRLTGEFAYRLDVPDPSTGFAQSDISISDIYAIDSTHLLVDEHDNVTDVAGQGQKGVYEIDLSGATNLVNDVQDNGDDPQLEADNAAGVVPVAKTKVIDLVSFGYSHDKPEGIGLFPNGDLAVQDDNDFGFEQGNDPENAGPTDSPFLVTPSGHTTQLWRFKLNAPGLPGGPGTPSGPGGPGGPGHPGHPVPPSHPKPPKHHRGSVHLAPTKVSFTVGSTSRKHLLGGGALAVTVRVPQRTSVRFGVTTRSGRHTTTLGSAATRLRSGKSVLRLRLSRHARSVLRSQHTLTLKISVRASASGHRATTKVVRLVVR